MSEKPSLDDLVTAVQSNPRYRVIHPGLVRRVAQQELSKGRSWKETIKATRNKLHQVGGAYQETEIDYAKWEKAMESLPQDRQDPAVLDFCLRMLQQHASTRERLPILEDFYAQTLASIAPIHSVMDFACGLNPLCLPWIPLALDSTYSACDIYQDQVEFIQHFFAHIQQPGEVFLCDLTSSVPERPTQLALLLKTIPCLEQLDKSIGARLLESIQAEHILVSFPARSLGGRSKGMVENYEVHFEQLIAGQQWTVRRYEFRTELAFLISRT